MAGGPPAPPASVATDNAWVTGCVSS
jgi:hypothetical protein